jgi:ribosomal protein S18 acetylase RimI-like enzyme
MSLVIENLSKDNIEDVILFHIKTCSDNYPKNVWVVHLKHYSNFCFVAKKQNNIVGYILCLRNPRYFNITNILVGTEHRRQGIAKKLIMKLISTFHNIKSKDVISACLDNTHPAIGLLKKFGFLINSQDDTYSLMLRQPEAKIDIPKKYFK